jgi:hypothetical protein
MKMYKGLKRRALVAIANEQKIGKRNSLFKEKEQQKMLVRMNKEQKKRSNNSCCKLIKNRK